MHIKHINKHKIKKKRFNEVKIDFVRIIIIKK